MTASASIRLADYTPWAFELPAIALDVNIQNDHVVVTSRLSLQPCRFGEPLVLCGVDLAIESLAIDQTPLQPEDYSFADGRLTIPNVPGQPFVLEPAAVWTPTPTVRSKACMPVVVCSAGRRVSGASACIRIVRMC